MKLAVAKRKYKGNWIAFRFSNEATQDGTVLVKDKDRHRLHKRLGSIKRLPRVYITFAGNILPEKFSIILSITP